MKPILEKKQRKEKQLGVAEESSWVHLKDRNLKNIRGKNTIASDVGAEEKKKGSNGDVNNLTTSQ